MNIDLVALRKALSAEKTDAFFSYYCHGHLHYHFSYNGSCYEFPLDTLEEHVPLKLSDDLGTTPFRGVMPAREMWRWIVKAYKAERLIKVR